MTTTFTVGAPYAAGDQGTFVSQLGFLPLTMQVVPGSVQFKFWFRDVDGDAEQVRVNLDTGDLVNNYGSFSAPFSPSFGGNGLIEGSFQADGRVNYIISAISGNFYADAAYAQLTASVPDGGSSVGMLGIGLLCIGLLGSFVRPARS